MKMAEVLGRVFLCECGRHHEVRIRDVLYAPDGISRLAGLMTGYFPGRTANLVADRRTWEAAGKDLEKELKALAWQVHVCLIPDPSHGDPVCDEATRALVEKAMIRPYQVLLAVGSGVANDLCKWIATDTKMPYAVVATAASMNGYASANIAPSIRGVKRVLDGVVPVCIATTPAIIRDAPARLTAAGLGDVVAKPVSMTDWRINHLLFNEYYCPRCAQLIRDIEPAYMDHPERIRQGDPATLEALFQALIASGIAMTIAGTSFPASGGEHMISHVLDMTAGMDGIPHDYHGRQVGLGTIFASALYERLVVLEKPRFVERTEPTDAEYWRELTPVVEEEHAHKRERVKWAVKRLRTPGVWDEARGLVRTGTVPAARIKNCLREAGAAHCIDHIGCTRERFLAAILHSHQIRERYTVIDLARSAGILPSAADEIVDQYLVK